MIKKIIYTILLILPVLFLISCDSGRNVPIPAFNPGESATPEELQPDRLFPSQTVKSWTYNYREVKYSYYYNRLIYDINTTEDWSVVKNVTDNGSTLTDIYRVNQGAGRSSKIYFEKRSNVIKWSGIHNDYSGDNFTFNGNLIIFPAQLNSTWNATIPFEGRDFYVEIENGQSKLTTISDIVETSAGRFTRCVRTDYTAKDQMTIENSGLSNVSGTITIWFVPDVGIVKMKTYITIQSIKYPDVDESVDVVRTLQSYQL